MVNCVGNVTQPIADPSFVNANIYIMDIRNFTWVNTLTLNPSTPISPMTSNKLPIKVVIGIIIGTIFGTVAFMTIGFFGYKQYQRRRQNEIMRIHGNIH